MQIKHLFLPLTIICTLLLPSFVRAQQDDPQVVNVPDPNLAAAIRNATDADTITTHTMLTLTSLYANGYGIEDLTGLEHAHNLYTLGLSDNNISDISPLAELKNAQDLRSLTLSHNNISDISPLAELTQVGYLHLDNNNISDISPLAELKNLRQLLLYDNNISDISPLAELTQVERLWLDDNNISDISPLAELKNLEKLLLRDNNISDVSPLAGLTQLEQLGLHRNNISDISPLAGLTKLILSWDILLYAKNLSELLPFAGRLEHLTFSYKNISNISPLAEFKNLVSLDLRNNNISDVSPLAELTQLNSLVLQDNNISDISPLAELTQLNSLNLENNNIFDVSPLAELTQLNSLVLQSNNISDVSPLVGLINLKQPGYLYNALSLSNNPLNYTSINTHIPAMQAKGIDVAFWERVPETLLQISGDTQQGGVNSTLPLPFVVEVLDQRRGRFSGVPVTFTITAGEGKLSATTVETDFYGRVSVHLRMGATPGTTTVEVSAPNISEPLLFTATTIPESPPVIVRDANLRAKIMETLGTPFGEVLTHTDMLQLRTLAADNMNIYDLTGLEYAANLTSLSLQDNMIANVLPLFALTQLTTLDLRNNWLSDVSPLTNLVHLKNGQGVLLQGNRLNTAAIHKYIPYLQTAGVNVSFDSTVTESEYIVRPIYLRGPGLRHDPETFEEIKNLMREVQQFYADQMEIYGFGRKTFQFETDADGNAFVYHVNGRFFGENALPTFNKFDSSKNIIRLLFVEDLNPNTVSYPCGQGHGDSHSGYAEVACFSFITVAHELGHAFGLPHDFRYRPSSPAGYIMSYGSQRMLSQCAAEWLDVHRYFNTERTAADGDVTIEVLPPLRHPPNAIRLRFNVTAPAGLHQARISGIDQIGTFSGRKEPGLIACKLLNGNQSETVDFVIPPLSPDTFGVVLTVVDKHGNTGSAGSGTVDVPSLLPEQPVSIPDPNLAAAIRKEIGEAITTRTLFNLIELSAGEITDLTGIEYASNLRVLGLSGSISDISPLSGLTQLRRLSLGGNNISDITALTELKNLRGLYLDNNNISDITSLAELKEIDWLSLRNNNISDISPLAEPTQIRWLYLSNNNISDVVPLVKLASVIPSRNSLHLYLDQNNISDISPFLALDPPETRRLWLSLWGNPLNDASRNRHIPALQAKGIQFTFSPFIQAYARSEITGPWLWMIAPTIQFEGGAHSIDVDSLAAASNGTVTEADVAIHGANAGDRLGNFVWTPGRISALQNNNINDCLNRIGMIEGDVNDHSAYALFSWVSDTDGTRRMYVGYDDAIKIWLNGEMVYRTAANRHLYNSGASFQVNLKRGQNLLLVKVSQWEGDWSMFVGIDGFEDIQAPDIAADVNGDGVVNVQDLVLVSANFGETGQQSADVNGDGVVNIADLVLIAGALGNAAAAPSAFRGTATALPSRATIEQWLVDAYRLPRLDARLARGIAWLEHILAALVPEETAVLTNYPNPFNPETWIPYELATPAEVTLRIYAVEGALVRRLVLGHRAAGIYRSKSRAAYWDGRNAQGEKVASGVYFYTFSAGDFEATRKMLVRK